MDEEKVIEQWIKDSSARFYKAFVSLSIEKMDYRLCPLISLSQ